MQISRYTWDTNNSAIGQVDFRVMESGAVEAFLYAPQASDGQLAAVPLELARQGLATVVDSIDGENVLRVTGFKKPEDLVKSLSQSGFIRGEAKQEVLGEKEHKTFTQKLRKQTVKVSGLFGIIGHASMAVAGILEKDYKRVGTSAFYTLSTSTSAIYGAGKPGAELEKLVTEMKGYLNDQGVEIPKSEKLTAQELAKKGGVIEKLHDFIQRRPIEVGNTVGLMGNLLFTYSGMKDGGVGASRAASGIASIIGALTVILVQEKHKGKDKKFEWPGLEREPGIAAKPLTAEQTAKQESSRSLPRKFADFVQEKPMRFAGLLNLAGNAAMFSDANQIRKKYNNTLNGLEQNISAVEGQLSTSVNPQLQSQHQQLLKEYKSAQRASKSVACTFTTASAYLLATCFTSLSSKSVPSDYNEQETLGKLCAMSAELIAEQPREVRDDAIGKMATFLAKEEKITESREEIIKIINDKVDTLGHSPWLAKLSTQQAIAANAAPQHGAQL